MPFDIGHLTRGQSASKDAQQITNNQTAQSEENSGSRVRIKDTII